MLALTSLRGQTRGIIPHFGLRSEVGGAARHGGGRSGVLGRRVLERVRRCARDDAPPEGWSLPAPAPEPGHSQSRTGRESSPAEPTDERSRFAHPTRTGQTWGTYRPSGSASAGCLRRGSPRWVRRCEFISPAPAALATTSGTLCCVVEAFRGTLGWCHTRREKEKEKRGKGIRGSWRHGTRCRGSSSRESRGSGRRNASSR